MAEPRPSFPLSKADLCINCEQIYQYSPNLGCPKCGSSAAFPVARVIAPLNTPPPKTSSVPVTGAELSDDRNG